VQLAARGRAVLAGHDFWSAERWHGGVWINRDGDSGDEDEDASSPPS
jgi:hypothetical protein